MTKPYTSYSTLVVPESPQMEYKYLLVTYIPTQQRVRVNDLSESGNPITNFHLILKQGWKPVRESKLGGGGDSTGMAVLILLERVWVPVPKLIKGERCPR